LIDHAERSKCKYLFIEASSIGYMEGRLGNLKFNLCLLTNLKSDHLDYHKNIKNYHLSKIDMIKKLSGKNSKILIQDYKLTSKLKTLNKTIYDQNNFIENHNLKIEIKNNC
jgi:UDP-N-acetylmuramyl tripeptide synthase